MKTSKVLPESFLRCLDPVERKKLGRAGLTAAECAAKQEARSERELQGQIVSLLRLKGIEPLWHRTDKRSAATVGWPDITFSVARVDSLSLSQYEHGQWTTIYPCAWEVKFGDGKLRQEQEQMALRLQSPPNYWRWKVIRSVDEAIAELCEMRIS